MICLTGKIVDNTPNVICRRTDTLTYLHIFCPDSGISSHSFGRSYRSSGSTVFFLLVDFFAFFGVVAAAEVPAFFRPPVLVAIGATAEEQEWVPGGIRHVGIGAAAMRLVDVFLSDNEGGCVLV